jgi:hypothetical protein
MLQVDGIQKCLVKKTLFSRMLPLIELVMQTKVQAVMMSATDEKRDAGDAAHGTLQFVEYMYAGLVVYLCCRTI